MERCCGVKVFLFIILRPFPFPPTVFWGWAIAQVCIMCSMQHSFVFLLSTWCLLLGIVLKEEHHFFKKYKPIHRTLEMASDALTIAGKHVMSYIACVRLASNSQNISLLIGPKDIVHYEVT